MEYLGWKNGEEEEIKPWEEAPRAEDRQPYDCGKEQAQRMESALGPELNRKLEIMAAKLEVIEKIIRACCYLKKENIPIADISKILDNLEQEIKAELKGITTS